MMVWSFANLNDPDNHDGVIIPLQPDILECKVKWALGSITTNKASRGDGIPLYRASPSLAAKNIINLILVLTIWWCPCVESSLVLLEEGVCYEVMEFQLSYFKSWKMMLWKCCTQYTSKFGKLSSGHRTGKGQFSFQSQRKAIPKNAQTTAQLQPSHMLVQ